MRVRLYGCVACFALCPRLRPMHRTQCTEPNAQNGRWFVRSSLALIHSRLSVLFVCIICLYYLSACRLGAGGMAALKRRQHQRKVKQWKGRAKAKARASCTRAAPHDDEADCLQLRRREHHAGRQRGRFLGRGRDRADLGPAAAEDAAAVHAAQARDTTIQRSNSGSLGVGRRSSSSSASSARALGRRRRYSSSRARRRSRRT